MKESQRQMVLFLVIGLVVLVCIGFAAFAAGRIRGVSEGAAAAPTATATLPPPIVNIQAIKAQADLITVEYGTVTEIYNETPPEGWLDSALGNKEKLLMLVYGDVQAGFDLDKLEEDDLWTDGKRVRLVLPSPEILATTIDFDRTHIVYYENKLLLDDNDPNLQGEALEQAQESVKQAALSEGVLEKANDHGKLYFENLLYSLGFTEVEVVVDAQIFRE